MTVILELYITPHANKIGFLLDNTQKIKCFLKSPATQGKANIELIKLLSQTLHIPQGDIFILAGKKSRHKLIKIITTIHKDALIKMLLQKN